MCLARLLNDRSGELAGRVVREQPLSMVPPGGP